MNQKLIYIAIGLILLTICYYAGKFAQRKNAEISRAKSEIKLYQFRVKQFQDSMITLDRKIKRLGMEVAELGKENAEYEKREAKIVTVIRYLPVTNYKSSELDSLWALRYKTGVR